MCRHTVDSAQHCNPIQALFFFFYHDKKLVSNLNKVAHLKISTLVIEKVFVIMFLSLLGTKGLRNMS